MNQIPYDRDAAVAYAARYALNYNIPNARYMEATSSWKGAQSLRVFLKYNQEEPRLPIEFLSSPYGLEKGDIVWALNDDGTSKAARIAHHMVLVDHVAPDGEIFIHGHTANKRNERWDYSREVALYEMIHIVPEALSSAS